MQIKTVAMMIVAGCAIGMLTGCGIPEEEHNAMIADINAKAKAQEDKLNSQIADLDSLLKAEQNKSRTTQITLADTTDQLEKAKKQAAETAKSLTDEKATVAGLEKQLANQKAATDAALAQAGDAEAKYNTLDVEYQELKRRFEMFQKNMSSLGRTSSPVGAAPAPASSGAPKTDAESAMDLLNQMGAQ